MRKYYLFLTFGVLANFVTVAQKKSNIYEFSTINQVTGDSVLFRLFYGIDSSKSIIFKGNKFYSFVFSSDSTENTGYIRFDSKSNCILFLSKYYKEKNKCKNSNQIQRLFCFYASKQSVCYAGFMGSVSLSFSVVTDKPKGVNIYKIKVTYPIPPMSGTIFITDIVFENKKYPKYVIFKDSVLDREVIVEVK